MENNKILKKKFVCQSCGKEIKFEMISVNDPFTKEDLLNCIKKDDYADLYMTNFDKLELYTVCCDNPRLSPEDAKLLEEHFELPPKLNKKQKRVNREKLSNELIEAAEEARDWISSFKQNMTSEERKIVKKLDNILNKITVDSKLTNEMRILQEFACEFHPIYNTKEIYNYNYRELVQIVKEIVEEM